MKIKANQNFYKNVLIVLAVLIVFIGSLAYFLGFNINKESLYFYFLFISFVIAASFALFLIIDKINNKYIIFDKEKIIEKNNDSEKIIVFYDQILFVKYFNRIDFIRGIIDFGYVEIMYKTDSKKEEPKYLNLYLSPKCYKQFLALKQNGLG